jgi:hypothetical protein
MWPAASASRRDGSVLGGRSRIIDFRGDRRSAYRKPGTEEDDLGLRNDRRRGAARGPARHSASANTLLRSRWEMYRPLLCEKAAFYPPNQFLDAPMTEGAQTKLAVETAMQNLVRAGIVTAA